MKKNLYILWLTLFLSACDSIPGNSGNTLDNFDRGTLLTNVADNIIIPSLKAFQTKLITLKQKTENFTSSTNVSTLEELRTAWYQAYKSWQHVGIFNIGKAEELVFDSFMNTFPLSIKDINNNITAGKYDLNHPNNRDAQGFPAFDYLLYGTGNTNIEILEKFTTNTNAVNYKKYLTDIIMKMTDFTEVIITDWEGTYRDAFVKSTGNTATSSLNKLVNDYIFYYEKKVRADKIGIPVGIFSGGTIFPEKVEAYYKKNISKELLLESITSVKNFFNGVHFSDENSGVGLKTYLEAIDKAGLAKRINAQLDMAKVKISMLDNNLSKQIAEDRDAVFSAYKELQKVVIMLKVELLEAIQVNVDYIDADGD